MANLQADNKRQVEFAPVQREDGRWALGIFFDGKPTASWFVHWIENGDGPKRICKISRGDIGFSVFSQEEADGICEFLRDGYATGEIE